VGKGRCRGATFVPLTPGGSRRDRVYEVPADTQYQAIDRFQEALMVHVEKDYLVKDLIRQPEDAPGKGKKISLELPKGWLALVKQQLLATDKR
jgi:hypothetical protein